MAMNNWGGIKEHMTRKPKKVFNNHRVSPRKRKFASPNDPFEKERWKIIEKKRRSKTIRWVVALLVMAVVVMNWRKWMPQEIINAVYDFFSY